MRRALVSAAIVLAAGPAAADVRLPALFSDHMVLQRDLAAPIWGWADPGESITITIAGRSTQTTTYKDGRWMVRLDPLSAGGPHILTVAGKNTLTVSDVLVGEVWLGSGQSNMVMQVNRAKDFDAERSAAKFPKIRMFTVERGYAAEPQTDCEGQWVVTDPETIADFSATAYFFGREIHKTLRVPVGLITSAVGGTPIQSWISQDLQESSEALAPMLALIRKLQAEAKAKAQAQAEAAAQAPAGAQAKDVPETTKKTPARPAAKSDAAKIEVAGLFNRMIAPLIPYAIRGALWYQGEANAKPDRGHFYADQLRLLVQDWRARWGQGDFPFAWMQLPNFKGTGVGWPEVREGMVEALALPHTGIAIGMDIGETGDIHPKNKQDVGRRLSAWALDTVYGKKRPWAGPLFAGSKVVGKTIVVSFTHADGGLVSKGGPPREFVIAGEDKNWVPAAARIQGNKVVLSSPDVPEPRFVRYAWSNDPPVNFFNRAGLPASPFRTDK